MTILIFVVGISLLILVHELGHFLAAKWAGLFVHEFGFGFPPRLFKKKIGETIYSLNLLPFGGFVRIHGENREEEEREKEIPRERSFASQPAWRRAFILAAGVVMNAAAGWVIFSALFWVGIPESVLVTDVRPESPAALANIEKGDRFLDFKRGDDFSNFVARSEGQEVALRIGRGREELTVRVTPRVNPPEGEGRLGVVFLEIGLPRAGFFSGLWQGLVKTAVTLAAITQAFGALIASIFTGGPALEQVTGPVGIFAVANESARYGLAALIQLIALISLNLAVLNVLPFPALDGGRLLFLLIEKIKGSPLSHKREQIANAIGFSLLIVLMVLVTVRDVAKLF